MTEYTPGTCYVCATPIGNLSDCSFRLIETLQHVDLIAAEDTRTSKILLDRYSIDKPLLSLEKHNEKARSHQLLQKLHSGQNIALLSDAGTPNISDPGAFLIKTLHDANIPVTPITGPSAITTLISVSGILANNFYFAGFFPRSNNQAQQLLKSVKALKCPVVFYESTSRILSTIKLLNETEDIEEIVAGKELTKKFETLFRGSPKEVLEHLQANTIKGEWCCMIRFKDKDLDTEYLKTTIQSLKKEGLSQRQVQSVAKLLGFPKNQVYSAYLEAENE